MTKHVVGVSGKSKPKRTNVGAQISPTAVVLAEGFRIVAVGGKKARKRMSDDGARRTRVADVDATATSTVDSVEVSLGCQTSRRVRSRLLLRSPRRAQHRRSHQQESDLPLRVRLLHRLPVLRDHLARRDAEEYRRQLVVALSQDDHRQLGKALDYVQERHLHLVREPEQTPSQLRAVDSPLESSQPPTPSPSPEHPSTSCLTLPLPVLEVVSSVSRYDLLWERPRADKRLVRLVDPEPRQ